MANGKKRVAVLFGGRSSEHEVSLRSAHSVIQNLDASQYEAVPMGIDREGRWYVGLSPDSFQPSAEAEVAVPSHLAKGAVEFHWRNRKGLAAAVDLFFPALHGPLYEDGALQGILESMDAAFVGAGVLGSAIGMDKDVSKRLLAQGGVPIVPYIKIEGRDWQTRAKVLSQQIESELGYPVFVKPNNTGSSVGVHKVKASGQLEAAIRDALQYDEFVLVEKGYAVREIELSALESRDGKPARISVAGEIIPRHEFYSYEAKYLDPEGAQLKIPAGFSPALEKEAQRIAGEAFRILCCSGMARVDLFLDKDTERFYLNEINTLPGFTSISMYPKLWAASGLSYTALLTELIELAWERANRKRKLKRDWTP